MAPKKNSLDQLQQVRTSSPQKNPDEEELDLLYFARAMQDVKPLNSKGREIIKAPAAPSCSAFAPKKISEKNIRFDIEEVNDYLSGNIHGLNPKTVRKLKNGLFPVEQTLDMHGLNAVQAYTRLLDVVHNCYRRKKRCLLALPGRGNNSPMGIGILREEIRTWLTKEPLCRVVLAFCTALPQHGGFGAVYILLRKYRQQDEHHIVWHKTDE